MLRRRSTLTHHFNDHVDGECGEKRNEERRCVVVLECFSEDRSEDCCVGGPDADGERYPLYEPPLRLLGEST